MWINHFGESSLKVRKAARVIFKSFRALKGNRKRMKMGKQKENSKKQKLEKTKSDFFDIYIYIYIYICNLR